MAQGIAPQASQFDAPGDLGLLIFAEN